MIHPDSDVWANSRGSLRCNRSRFDASKVTYPRFAALNLAWIPFPGSAVSYLAWHLAIFTSWQPQQFLVHHTMARPNDAKIRSHPAKDLAWQEDFRRRRGCHLADVSFFKRLLYYGTLPQTHELGLSFTEMWILLPDNMLFQVTFYYKLW